MLIVIIYLAFISLGLPDSLLGSAWPAMHKDLGAEISAAGLVSMIISGGTIVSSLCSDKLISRFKTGPVTIISVALTALALLGISQSSSFLQLCLWAIPLGLGAGSVDAALNNFVALHYQAHHMNWLHCFWGVGAAAGPMIMAHGLLKNLGWSWAYACIALLQMGMFALLALSLPLWRSKAAPACGKPQSRQAEHSDQALEQRAELQEIAAQADTEVYNSSLEIKDQGGSLKKILALPKAKVTLLALFCYCGLELTAGLWASSYLVALRGWDPAPAARAAAGYYGGITLGRALAGILSLRLSPRQLIRLGLSLIALGLSIICLLPSPLPSALGLGLIGLGCAPIYPNLLHETPRHFGSANSQLMMGLQMACAYTGSTLMPPLLGLLAASLGYGLFPFFLACLLLLMALSIIRIYKA